MEVLVNKLFLHLRVPFRRAAARHCWSYVMAVPLTACFRSRDEFLRGSSLQRAQERLPDECGEQASTSSFLEEGETRAHISTSNRSICTRLSDSSGGRLVHVRAHADIHTHSHSDLPGSNACLTNQERTLHHVCVWPVQRHLLIRILAVPLQSPPTSQRTVCTGSFPPFQPRSWPPCAWSSEEIPIPEAGLA